MFVKLGLITHNTSHPCVPVHALLLFLSSWPPSFFLSLPPFLLHHPRLSRSLAAVTTFTLERAEPKIASQCHVIAIQELHRENYICILYVNGPDVCL
jgi:hypothetical protein